MGGADFKAARPLAAAVSIAVNPLPQRYASRGFAQLTIVIAGVFVLSNVIKRTCLAELSGVKECTADRSIGRQTRYAQAFKEYGNYDEVGLAELARTKQVTARELLDEAIVPHGKGRSAD